MSTRPPRPSHSNSPPRRSPKSSSEKRRPLHERSDSDTNIVSGGDSGRISQDSAYTKDPFPRLPSQILLPKSSSAPFVFEDETATVGPNEDDDAADSKFQHRILRAEPSDHHHVKGKANVRPSPSIRKRMSAFDTPPPRPKPASSLADRFKQRHRAGGEPFRPRASFDSGQGSIRSTKSARESSPGRSERDVELATIASPAESTSRRLRRRSSASELSRPQSNALNEATPERPRSASTPAAPTDAFLEALIANGESVQYPELRKPSVQSLRSQSSSTRMAYPPPLRLHRKPGNSKLNVAAGVATAHGDELEPGSSKPPRQIRRASIPLSLNPVNQKTSSRWTDELDDTVAELQSPLPKRQHSMYNRDSTSDRMRSSSFSSSHSSSNGSRFFNFGNDSKTAWASTYYRSGEGALRLMTPPSVTNLQSMNSLRGRPASSRPRSKSASAASISGRSSSPDSFGFPEAIYIPRSRPFQREVLYSDDTNYESSIIPEPSIIDELPSARRTESMVIEPVSSQPEHTVSEEHVSHLPAQPVRRRTQSSTLERSIAWSGPFNPTPEVPHLSIDRGYAPYFQKWRAPSIEESQSWFGSINRQILLFSFGFIFPFAWIIAAFLPIPTRPDWHNDDTNFELGKNEAEATDLYYIDDVRIYQKARWWRNLNRFMCFTGLCVIVIVIVVAVVSTH